MNDFDQDLKQLAKHTRRKRWLMTAGIALVTGLLLLVGLYFGLQRVLERRYQATDAAFVTRETIESPNIVTTTRYLTNQSLFSAELVSDRYKNIDGYQVPWAQARAAFGWFQGNQDISSDGVDATAYGLVNRATRQKLPLFTNPRAKTYHPLNELPTLKTSPNAVAEVALTFKQPLTYAQIRQRMPANLLINWYWVGTASRYDVTQSGRYIGVNADEKNGQLTNSMYSDFVQQVHTAAKQNAVTIADADGQTYHFYRDGVAQTPTTQLAQAKFSGVIVSGKTSNLLKLTSQTWIADSSVGTIVPIRGDIAPLK